jgi:hypothetical protein
MTAATTRSGLGRQVARATICLVEQILLDASGRAYLKALKIAWCGGLDSDGFPNQEASVDADAE